MICSHRKRISKIWFACLTLIYIIALLKPLYFLDLFFNIIALYKLAIFLVYEINNSVENIKKELKK